LNEKAEQKSLYTDSSSEYQEISNENAESKMPNTVSSNIHQAVKEQTEITSPCSSPRKKMICENKLIVENKL